MSVSSKSQYVAYQIEDTNGVAKKPNKFIPTVENSLSKNVENIRSESRQNTLNNVNYLAKGTPKIEGDITTELDAVNVAPWFLLLLGQIASTDVSSGTDGSVYKHEIKDKVCGYKSLTIESKKG